MAERNGVIDMPAEGVIDVWAIDLEVPASAAKRLSAVLDDEEMDRLAGFRTESLRRRFAVAHAATRQILGGYLNLPFEAMRFNRGANNKPAVRGFSIAFNLSHSGELALCAVAAGGRLGVDIETVRAVPDAESLVSRFLARGEAEEFFQLPVIAREHAFLRAWTRKEAFMKATGEGMRRALDSFDVAIGPSAARLLRVDSGEDVCDWWMQALDAWPGYVATVAHDRRIESVRCRTWREVSTDVGARSLQAVALAEARPQ